MSTNHHIFIGLGNDLDGTTLTPEACDKFWSERAGRYTGYQSLEMYCFFQGRGEKTKSMYICGIDTADLLALLAEYQETFGTTDTLVFVLDLPPVERKPDYIANSMRVLTERSVYPAVQRIFALPGGAESMEVVQIREGRLHTATGVLPARAHRLNQVLQTVPAWSVR